MGKKKPGLEQVDVKTGEQKGAINDLLAALGGKSGDILGGLGGAGVLDQPIFQEALGTLSGQLGQGFDPESVSAAYQQNVADPARQNFMQQTLPAIQERLGRSSATGNVALKGATDLEKQLAGGLSQELLNQQNFSTQAQQNAIAQALGYAQAPQQSQMNDIQALLQALGLGTGTDLFALQQTPGKAGFGGAIGTALGAGLGSLAGPGGAQIGGQLGGAIGSQF
jgi:hypothetical protein